MKFLPVALLAILTGVRLWMAAALPVTPLEAYHWMGAQRLDWAFFDGPGGTAALVRLTTVLLGDGSLGLRLAFPFFAAIATYGIFLFVRALFGSTAGLWAAVALNTLPIFQAAATHAGSPMPALAFLLLAAWAFVRALDLGIAWWTGAGFCLMLAEQFQTFTALLAVGFVLACAVPRRHRREWRRPGIYFALYLALTGLLPIVLWNGAKDWPALALGTWRTALTPPWGEIPREFGASLLLLSLPAALVLAALIGLLAASARRHFRPRIVLGLIVPLVGLWVVGVVHADPAAIWALLAVFALGIGAAVPEFLKTPVRRWVAAGLLIVSTLCAAIGGSFGLDPWSRSAQGPPWREVAEALAPLLSPPSSSAAAPLFLIAPTPEATAALSYHLSQSAAAPRAEVFLRESQDVSNQFGLWPRYDDFVPAAVPLDDFFKAEGNASNPNVGRSALYLTDEEPADLPQTITSAFGRVTSTATLDLTGGRRLRVYLCEDYQTMPL